MKDIKTVKDAAELKKLVAESRDSGESLEGQPVLVSPEFTPEDQARFNRIFRCEGCEE